MTHHVKTRNLDLSPTDFGGLISHSVTFMSTVRVWYPSLNFAESHFCSFALQPEDYGAGLGGEKSASRVREAHWLFFATEVEHR